MGDASSHIVLTLSSWMLAGLPELASAAERLDILAATPAWKGKFHDGGGISRLSQAWKGAQELGNSSHNGCVWITNQRRTAENWTHRRRKE